jgi:DnaK suppressor protein
MNDHATDFSAEATEQHLQLAGGFYFTEDYVPSEDEPYMNPRQLEYFRGKLLDWREKLLKDSGETLGRLRAENSREIDILDRGAMESDTVVRIKNRDRCEAVIREIDEALERIQDGSYGYCDETGEQIGLKRLEARPSATLSIEAQEWRERGRRRKARWNLAYA